MRAPGADEVPRSLLDAQLEMRLARALGELAPAERALLDLTYRHRMPDSEIAALTAATPIEIEQLREEVVGLVMSTSGARRGALVMALEVPPPMSRTTTIRFDAGGSQPDALSDRSATHPAVPGGLLRLVAFALMPIACTAGMLAVALRDTPDVTTPAGPSAGTAFVAVRPSHRAATVGRDPEPAPAPARIGSRTPSRGRGAPKPPPTAGKKSPRPTSMSIRAKLRRTSQRRPAHRGPRGRRDHAKVAGRPVRPSRPTFRLKGHHRPAIAGRARHGRHLGRGVPRGRSGRNRGRKESRRRARGRNGRPPSGGGGRYGAL